MHMHIIQNSCAGLAPCSRLGANKQRAEPCVPRYKMPGPEAASATCGQVKAPKRDDMNQGTDLRGEIFFCLENSLDSRTANARWKCEDLVSTKREIG